MRRVPLTGDNPAMNERSRYPEDVTDEEWSALTRIVGYGLLAIAWGLWFLSLPMSMFMFFAFDSEVYVRDGIILGVIQATWVAGIPVALLFVRHVAGHGFEFPEWQARWLLVLLCAIAWIGIVVLWVWSAAGCNTCQ